MWKKILCKIIHMGAEWEQIVHRFFWDGGSDFDAWLNIASTKTVVTIARSWAQAGLPSALVAQLLHLLMGWWTGYIINLLYLKHGNLVQKRTNHTVQLHEVLGGLMGRRWKAVALFLNIGTFFFISVTQLLSFTNIAYGMNNQLDKRTWTLVFGAVFLLSILIPSARNYRAWSFIGVVSTIYIGVYLFIVGLSHKTVKNVHRPYAPRSFSEYFISLTNTVVLGTQAIPVEIMDAMWQPKSFQAPWFYGMLYTATISFLPTMGIFWRFGDRLLKHHNVLLLVPRTIYRDAAMVLLLIHQQFIAFGTFTLPVYLIFEKMFKVDNSSNFGKRILVRIPVFLVIWLAALALPSFLICGPLFVSIFFTWNLYVLPCAAYIWKVASSHLVLASPHDTSEKPFSMLRWEVIFSINVGIILWMIVISGLGLANSPALLKQVQHIGLFTKCYFC